MPISPIGGSSPLHTPPPESHPQKLANHLGDLVSTFAELIGELMHHPPLVDNREYLEKVAANILALNKPSLEAKNIEVN